MEINKNQSLSTPLKAMLIILAVLYSVIGIWLFMLFPFAMALFDYPDGRYALWTYLFVAGWFLVALSMFVLPALGYHYIARKGNEKKGKILFVAPFGLLILAYLGISLFSVIIRELKI